MMKEVQLTLAEVIFESTKHNTSFWLDLIVALGLIAFGALCIGVIIGIYILIRNAIYEHIEERIEEEIENHKDTCKKRKR